jgi:inositol-phosphate transport system ATP-binding protein
MEIRLEGLTKHYGPQGGQGDVAAVDDLTLQVRDGEFVALLGPSGCGKTTTLLMLAGILRPTAGTIRFGDRVVNLIPPQERNIGMVFQSYALYPHMTAYQNITYPLRLRHTPEAEMRQQAERVAERLEIGSLLKRKPGELSGGQQQRVALARALIKQPDLLLFDEPLSNLDARLRLTTRSEIKRLQREFGITSIYVTHDQVEALTMADRIAVLRSGKLEAYGTPNELYERPRTRFVASFIGHPPMNLLPATLAVDGGQTVVRAAQSEVGLPESIARNLNGNRQAEREVLFGFRPEDITPSDDGQIAGEVDLVEPLGRDDLLVVRAGDAQVHALAPAASGFKSGSRLRLRLDPERVHLFDPATERSLLWN